MKAVQISELTGPQAVASAEVERPAPGPGQTLIRVAAAGVTFPELLQTRGMYQAKHELPYTAGSEGAGTVEEAGPGSAFAVGDRVAFIGGKGSWAEYAIADDTATLALPDSMSFRTAAGIPMNILTADFALRVRGGLQPGQTVLVHGAAGGLGIALIQVALAMGAEVIAVVSTEEKAAVVREVGAQHVVLAEGFKDAVKEAFPRGVDLVADPVGGDRFTDSLRTLAPFGTLLVLGFTAGSIPEVKVNRLLLGNIAVAGVAWGEASRLDPTLIQSQWKVLLPYAEDGRLDPHIHAVYGFDDAPAALAELDGRAVRGKVLLVPGDPAAGDGDAAGTAAGTEA